MQLILFYFLISLTIFSKEEDYAVIIIDDCQAWESYDWGWWPNINKDELDSFTIKKFWDNNSNLFVAANHTWNYFIGTGRPTEIDKATKKMTYQELLDSSPMYSSEMSYLDWRQISRKHFDLVYVLRPEDYCKEGGIDTGKQITVYQVNLTFPFTE